MLQFWDHFKGGRLRWEQCLSICGLQSICYGMLMGGEGLLRLTHTQQNLFTSPDSLKGWGEGECSDPYDIESYRWCLDHYSNNNSGRRRHHLTRSKSWVDSEQKWTQLRGHVSHKGYKGYQRAGMEPGYRPHECGRRALDLIQFMGGRSHDGLNQREVLANTTCVFVKF